MCIELIPALRKSVVLIVLYRPPDSTAASTITFLDSLQELALKQHSDILIAVDLNIDTCSGIPCANSKRLDDLKRLSDFTSLVDGFTRVTDSSATTIDHLLCRSTHKFVRAAPIDFCYSEHRMIICGCHCQLRLPKTNPRMI